MHSLGRFSADLGSLSAQDFAGSCPATSQPKELLYPLTTASYTVFLTFTLGVLGIMATFLSIIRTNDKLWTNFSKRTFFLTPKITVLNFYVLFFATGTVCSWFFMLPALFISGDNSSLLALVAKPAFVVAIGSFYVVCLNTVLEICRP